MQRNAHCRQECETIGQLLSQERCFLQVGPKPELPGQAANRRPCRAAAGAQRTGPHRSAPQGEHACLLKPRGAPILPSAYTLSASNSKLSMPVPSPAHSTAAVTGKLETQRGGMTRSCRESVQSVVGCHICLAYCARTCRGILCSQESRLFNAAAYTRLMIIQQR